jgi:putative flippase GtrA
VSFGLPIYVRYALFAAIATAVNLGSQALELHVYSGPMTLTIAIILGTGTGLVTKYVLDKHWIFFDRSTGAAANSRKFVLYTATGIATTAIFWGFEYGFDAMTADGRWRYLGAVIGLAIGYVAKYRLDRRFVFNRTAL